jgi:PKD repeat protein
MDRAHERILGTVLVVLGVGLLLFAVDQAWDHSNDLTSHTATPPTAAFTWQVTGLSATFTDLSHGGSAAITSTYWEFGDGNSTYTTNTSHTYGTAGTYNVTLVVEDSNGNLEQSTGLLVVGTGDHSTGAGSPSTTPPSLSGVLGNLDLGGSISSLVSTVELFVLLAVLLLAGSAILRAGWNLITPKAETIQVRVKPKSLTVEPVGGPVPAAPSPPPMPGAAVTSAGPAPSGAGRTSGS